MSLQSKHPDYAERVDQWRKCRDVYEGEGKVKEKGKAYLKPTSGMVEDGCEHSGQPGWHAYEAYKTRATMPDMYREAVDALVGVMHREDAVVNLPAKMEFMRESATARGETLMQLLRRINEEQLKVGRLGLMADVVDSGPRRDQPYVAVYEAEDVGNWDEGRREDVEVDVLNLVVLDESGPERIEDFEWKQVEKYRVLQLQRGDGQEFDADGSVRSQTEGTYATGLFREDSFDPLKMLEPSILGNALDEIPFVFVNPKDTDSDPDVPPLLGLCDLVLVIYRAEADYRQALFMQGQDTLVFSASSMDPKEPVRTGAGGKVVLQTEEHAEYVGVDSAGLPELRGALENDYSRAEQKGAQLLRQMTSDAESGEALRVRVAARTATLSLVAKTGAAALERILRIVAKWLGVDPMEVTVEPNLKFAEQSIEGRTVVDLVTAKRGGLPIAWETMHEFMQDRNLTSLSFEEEIGRLRAEVTGGMDDLLGGGGSSDPEGPQPDEEEDEGDEEEEEDADDEGEDDLP